MIDLSSLLCKLFLPDRGHFSNTFLDLPASITQSINQLLYERFYYFRSLSLPLFQIFNRSLQLILLIDQ